MSVLTDFHIYFSETAKLDLSKKCLSINTHIFCCSIQYCSVKLNFIALKILFFFFFSC
uniref:Uncharacterized protein n=1 Tax=Octopus bimaculoides TaxID=37653 RepID=A0A0L8HTA1_OCTBM